MIQSELIQAVLPVANAFEVLGVTYFLGGSVASSAYGFARTTLDVDLVADLAEEHADPLTSMLSGEYYVNADMIRMAIEREASFNVVHLKTMFKVDVFQAKSRAYDRAALSRVQRLSLSEEEESITVPIASPEDLVLNKLEWYEKGERVSERQWRDVLGVLKVQADALDRAYLVTWAGTLGISQLLQQALSQAGVEF